MDVSKLKIDMFKNVSLVNFPSEINLELESTNHDIEVLIYYIDSLEDINNFVEYVNRTELPKENRTIMVYRKGRKDINRDLIITPFKSGEIKGFKLKAPMLCSLSKEYSAFVMMKE